MKAARISVVPTVPSRLIINAIGNAASAPAKAQLGFARQLGLLPLIDLVGLGIDIAVRFGALKDSSLMAKKLGDNRRLICAAPDYIKKHGDPKHPDDLKGHNCLIMKFGPVIDREWTFKVSGRQRAYTVSGNRTTNNGAQVHKWCLEGRGIALKSIWDVKEDIKAGRLTELLPNFAQPSNSSLQLVYPGGGKPNRRIRALIDFLASDF